MAEWKGYYFVWRDSKNSRRVEIRVDFRGQPAAALPERERWLYATLQTSHDLVNHYLRYLAAGRRRQPGTIYEYAKILRYCLEWLALEPKNIYGQQVVQSLLRLRHADVAALLAWMNIPNEKERARTRFAGNGYLQPEMYQNTTADTTRNMRESCLHGFYEWLLGSKEFEGLRLPERNPVKSVETPTPDPVAPDQHKAAEDRGLRQRSGKGDVVILEPAEYKLLLQVIPEVSGHQNCPVLKRGEWCWCANQRRRDELIVRAMTIGLMRPSELPHWRWDGVDREKKSMLVRTIKYGHLHPDPRNLYMPDSLFKLIWEYSAEMAIPASQARTGPIIRTSLDETKQVTERVIDKLVEKVKKHCEGKAKELHGSQQPEEATRYQAIADKIHPHVFRKTGATWMAASGVDILLLAEAMGHSHTETTRRYYIAAKRLRVAERLMEIMGDDWVHLMEGKERKQPEHVQKGHEFLAQFGIRIPGVKL